VFLQSFEPVPEAAGHVDQCLLAPGLPQGPRDPGSRNPHE